MRVWVRVRVRVREQSYKCWGEVTSYVPRPASVSVRPLVIFLILKHIKFINSLVCDRFIDTSKTEYLTPMTYSATLSMAYSRMYHSTNSFSNRDSLFTNDDNNNKPNEEAPSQRKKPLSFQKQNITATTHFQSTRKKNIASRPSPAAEEEVEENTASNKLFYTG